MSEIIEKAACDSENCLEMYTREREGKLEQLYLCAFGTIFRTSSVFKEANINCIVLFSFTRHPKNLKPVTHIPKVQFF